ncbi:prolipoprotein diacylglyceryl transferase [Uliginosibacterium flavum]|uniref:Phosphatidylglycerol--prolipoprotein diacylglyceryl transferase n=1 Tax=Uliginosibacterium flavum TaxID=1396831 RepID=A0ABV2THJ5_9RHOO
MPFIHPQFDPIAFSLGPLHVRWYGLMYLLAFLLFVLLGRARIKARPDLGWQRTELDDLLFYGMLGVILGGRLGYILFYKLGDYLADPIAIFKVWEGGMAFHGGLIGVLLALWYFARKTKRSWMQVADFVAPLVPTGLAVGRLGNFINGELWGRIAAPDAPWAVIFPQAWQADQALVKTSPALASSLLTYIDPVTQNTLVGLPRHASQLYQFALEGLLLFVILWLFARKPRPTGAVAGLFLTGYGCFRFIAEFAREPDDFLGLLAGQLSMGQWLSLPMIAAGLGIMVWAYRNKNIE